MITFRFSGRTPTPAQAQLGMETDQEAERIRFLLPQIGDTQAAQLCVMMPDDTPEVLHIRDGLVTVPRKMTEIPGRSRAWVEILGDDNIAWNSEIFYLDVGDLPPISERIELLWPTALMEAIAAGLKAERCAAMAEAARNVILACGVLFHVEVDEDSETLVIDRASIYDERAYDIAVKNGYTGTEEEWNAYIETLGTNFMMEEIREQIQEVNTLAQEAKTIAEGRAIVKEASISIPADAWQGSAAPYTATISCSVVKAEDKVIAGIGESASKETQEAAARARIGCVGQGEGVLSFRALEEKPEVSIPVNVIALEG